MRKRERQPGNVSRLLGFPLPAGYNEAPSAGAFQPHAFPTASRAMRPRILLLAGRAAVLGRVTTSYTDPANADEGMWLFNNPPRAQLKKYGFEPTDKWLDHVRLASVRFNSGGSGSFVSPNGLVMTNHHVGAGDLEKVSTPEKNYLRDGFHAKTSAEEIKCKGLELNVLTGIKDVTAEVEKAVPAGPRPPRRSSSARPRSRSSRKRLRRRQNIRADVVTLYAGGQYHLYTFKKYTDIRIVFAPEKQIAFFGGDPDNSVSALRPRCLLLPRLRERQADQVRTLPDLESNGSKPDELVFVSSHPGRTNRANTLDELKYLRDTGYPYLLNRLNRLEVLLGAWSGRSGTRSAPKKSCSVSRTAARRASAVSRDSWTRR